jgi:hypothetical protein
MGYEFDLIGTRTESLIGSVSFGWIEEPEMFIVGKESGHRLLCCFAFERADESCCSDRESKRPECPAALDPDYFFDVVRKRYF